MEDVNLLSIPLAQFKSFFQHSPNVALGDEFCILDVKLGEHNDVLGHPCRFDFYMLLYCLNGHVKMNVNLTEFQIQDGMTFLNVPGNIIRVNELVDTQKEDLHYLCICMSRNFLQGMMMDVSKFFNEGLSLMENPSLRLNAEEKDLMTKQVEMIASVIKADLPYKNDVVKSIVSSMFYLIMGVWSDRLSSERNVEQVKHSRSKVIFDQFIKLVTEYHTQERNVGFYADQLCLTPKYLSKLIKGATGRSAPDWIDTYVILEAKNLLKYSNVTIKEIVYKLNFPNQSVFYKFFKARTGMTPTEYRNS